MSDLKCLTGEMANEVFAYYTTADYCSPSEKGVRNVIRMTDDGLSVAQALALDQAISDGLFTLAERDALFGRYGIAPGFLDAIREGQDESILGRRLELMTGELLNASPHYNDSQKYKIDELVKCVRHHPYLSGMNSPVLSALQYIAANVGGHYAKDYINASIDRITGADRPKYTLELADRIREAVYRDGIYPDIVATASGAEYYLLGTEVQGAEILSYSQARMLYYAFFDPQLIETIEEVYGLPQDFVLRVVSPQ